MHAHNKARSTASPNKHSNRAPTPLGSVALPANRRDDLPTLRGLRPGQHRLEQSLRFVSSTSAQPVLPHRHARHPPKARLIRPQTALPIGPHPRWLESVGLVWRMGMGGGEQAAAAGLPACGNIYLSLHPSRTGHFELIILLLCLACLSSLAA